MPPRVAGTHGPPAPTHALGGSGDGTSDVIDGPAHEFNTRTKALITAPCLAARAQSWEPASRIRGDRLDARRNLSTKPRKAQSGAFSCVGPPSVGRSGFANVTARLHCSLSSETAEGCLATNTGSQRDDAAPFHRGCGPSTDLELWMRKRLRVRAPRVRETHGKSHLRWQSFVPHG